MGCCEFVDEVGDLLGCHAGGGVVDVEVDDCLGEVVGDAVVVAEGSDVDVVFFGGDESPGFWCRAVGPGFGGLDDDRVAFHSEGCVAAADFTHWEITF